MSDKVEIKQNDTRPALEATLLQAGGTPIDLTDADTVLFRMETEDEETVVDSEASVVDAQAGEVKYEWDSADTANVGRYNAEFDVTFTDGGEITVPNNRYFKVIIRREITS